MQKNSLASLILIFFLGLLPLKAYPVEEVRNIVVFFSLNSNLPAYKNFLEGLRSTISKNSNESRNLIIEYLDIARTDEVYAKHIVNIYNNKFKSLKTDLLITFGPGLDPVLIKYGLEAFKTIPIINIDVDMPGRINSLDTINQNRSEILVKFRLENTLKTAFNLFPDYKNVYVISGNTPLDQFFNSLVNTSEQSFEKDHVFKNITGISMDSTLRLAREIPAESIVIVPNYFADGNNVPYTISEAISFISANCKAPVLPATDSFTEKSGGIGGYVYSYTSLGKETGRIANEILNGRQAKDIQVKEDFYEHIYNWKELRHWNLLRSNAIPGNSIFLNESFFSRYKYYYGGILIFLIAQTLLILYLIRLNKIQKKISEQMLETEQMHSELLREDRLSKMTELTASLSHELNQPLTAILYSAQAGKHFLQKDKLDQSRANEIFDNIIEDDKRAGKIISSVRNLMKSESKEHEKINMNVLIQETKDIFQSEAIRKNIRINMNVSTYPIFVSGDKTQLQQVLMNLIRNSFNAMEESDTEKKILDLKMNLIKDSIIVSVRDTGPGIDPGINGKLFKPFITTRKNGSGIGLALSRSIVEKHNGVIWAENIEGGGADFSFRLQIIKD